MSLQPISRKGNVVPGRSKEGFSESLLEAAWQCHPKWLSVASLARTFLSRLGTGRIWG